MADMSANQGTASRQLLCDRFHWINDYVPCFGMNGKNVYIIKEPVEFYETLKVNKHTGTGLSHRARQRIRHVHTRIYMYMADTFPGPVVYPSYSAQ